MNRVLLTGRLTKDPEFRTTTTGLSVSSFSIAINRAFKNKEGNYDTDFFNVSVFGKQAENVSKYCFKGSQVGVEGRLQSRSYDAQDGTKRYVVDVVADRVEFLGSKKDNTPSEYSSTNISGFVDPMPADPIDVQTNNINETEIELPEGDPYKNFGDEITITDDDLPF